MKKIRFFTLKMIVYTECNIKNVLLFLEKHVLCVENYVENV